jgi:hypothetical protein
MRTRGLLALVAALTAFAVAAPTAGAVTFEGGSLKVDVKTLTSASGAKATFGQATSKGKTSATFTLGAGNADISEQTKGTFNALGTITLKLGRKSVALGTLQQKFTNGRGTIIVKPGSGKAVSLLSVASQGKMVVDAGYVGLTEKSSALKLTKKGAAALNKALKPSESKEFKTGQKVGKVSMVADRSLELTGGNSRTVYDEKFVNDLAACDISLSSIAPATPIGTDASAPKGGVELPFRSTVEGGAGSLNARTLGGTIRHSGGTALRQDPNSSQVQDRNGDGIKDVYASDITNFEFDTRTSPPTLAAFSTAVNNRTNIGAVEGAVVSADLTPTGGTVTLQNGILRLADIASSVLSQQSGCNIPAGSAIGRVTTTGQV